jgi:hypothetical protein
MSVEKANTFDQPLWSSHHNGTDYPVRQALRGKQKPQGISAPAVELIL